MKKFHSKILLFGEYSVLVGSSALTVPFKKYSGEFSFSDLSTGEEIESNEILNELGRYIQQNRSANSIALDLALFQSDLEKGLYFKSSIPVGYGLGSSGALVAALFDSYSNQNDYKFKNNFLQILQHEMAVVESFFHGTSSGIDPLSVFIGQPLQFINTAEIIQPYDKLFQKSCDFYLYDTGIKSGTGSMVDSFVKKLQNPSFKRAVDEILIPAVNRSIKLLTGNNITEIKADIQAISHFQFENFNETIPSHILHLWQTGLKTGDYYFKLCGSGGGGFMLVWSKHSKVEIERILKTQLLSIV